MLFILGQRPRILPGAVQASTVRMSDSFTTRPEIRGTFGVVSSTHWLASQVAMSVLERGGNAFDASVAGGFALQVVEPHLNGPGGEVPILFWSEREQRMRSLQNRMGTSPPGPFR